MGTRTDGGHDGRKTTTTVPRRVAAFVGRFHKDTTADDVISLMEARGMTNVKCFKLASKDGRTFSTAAFYVSCPTSQQDKLYDERVWPDGSEVREWYFKKSSTDTNGQRQ